MPSDDQVINSISQSLQDLENSLTRFVAKTEASTKKFESLFKRMPTAANQGARGVEKSFNGASAAASNLSFQLNDIGMMMAAGQNPFMLMIQQGSQVSQIMGELSRQGGSIKQVVVGAFSQMLNPIGLVSVALIGLTAYAVQYFTAVKDGGKETETAMKEQAQLIDGVVTAWGELLPTLKEVREQQKAIAAEQDKKGATQAAAVSVYQELGKELDKLAPKIEGINYRVDQASRARTSAGLATGFDELRRKVEKASATVEDLDKVIANLKALPNQTPEIEDLVFALEKQKAALQAAADTTARLRNEEKAATVERKNLVEFTESMAKVNKTATTSLDQLKQQYVDYIHGIRDSTNFLALAVEATKAYNEQVAEAIRLDMAEQHKKAVEALQGYAPKLSEIEGFMAAYTKAIATATTEQEKLNIATQSFISLQGIVSTAGNKWLEIGQKMSGVWNDHWTDFRANYDSAMGDLNTYLAQIDAAEGRAKNSRSSAQGFGQFIDSTWIAEIKQHRPDLAAAAGFDDAEILKLRSQVDLAKEITHRFAEDNAKDLQIAGEKASVANLHLSHFLGVYDAIKVLQAAPGTPLKGLISDASIASNPEVLGGGKTVEDVLAYAQSRAKVTGAIKEEKSAVDSLVQSMNAQLESQQRQNAINADGTKTVDQKTFALLKEENMTKLLAAAQQDGIKVSKEQMAAFDALATKMASAGLSAEQLKTKQAELDRQTEESTRKAQQLAAQYEDMASSAISGFINDLRHGVSAGEAFSKMLDQLIGQLIEMAVKAAVANSGIGSFLAGIGGGGFNPLTATPGLWSAGGKVGFTGAPKGKASPAAFAGARSMASGGIVGDPSAVPIIAHRGEVVIPRSAMQKAATQTRQGNQTTIDARSSLQVDIANGTGDTKVTTEGGIQFARMLESTVQAVIIRESRPGGLLRAQTGAR